MPYDDIGGRLQMAAERRAHLAEDDAGAIDDPLPPGARPQPDKHLRPQRRPRAFRVGWRALIVASILGLWLAVGTAWGAGAALVFAYPVFVATAFATWLILAAQLTQRVSSTYHERQMRHR